MERQVWLSVALLGLATLSACSSPTRPTLSDEDAVKQRASERWSLLIERRAAEAYEYIAPGTRQVLRQEAYQDQLRRSRVTWARATPQSVTCSSAARCVAAVEVHYELRNVLPGVPVVSASKMVEESWIKSKEQWYFVPRSEGGGEIR